jgi:hypothetical protein
MGGKHRKIDVLIKNLLSNGDKFGWELESTVLREKIPKHGEEINDIRKAFYYALNKLLENEEIKIIKYKPRGLIKQSFSPHSFQFTLSERLTRPGIKELLNDMDKNIDSYREIRELFKEKLSHLYDFEDKKWDYLKTWIFSATPHQITNLLGTTYDLKKIENELNKMDPEQKQALYSVKNLKEGQKPNEMEKYIFTLFNSRLGDEYHIALLLEHFSRYSDKKNMRLWFYPCAPEDYDNLLPDYDYLPDTFLPDEVRPKPNTPQEERTLTLNGTIDIMLYNYYQVDIDGVWSKDLALSFAGFYPPHRTFEDNLDLAFEYTMDIMSLYTENDQKLFNNILAKALSDEPRSIQVLLKFWKKMEKLSYDDRLTQILGILSKSPNRFPF